MCVCVLFWMFDALDKRRRCATINIPIELLLRIAFVLNEFVGSDIDRVHNYNWWGLNI